MKKERKLISPENRAEHIELQTYWTKRQLTDFITISDKMTSDAEKENRLKSFKCRYDFYQRGGIAGAAMTEYNCELCNSNQIWNNTNSPRVCEKCAEEFQICVRCSGDINL
jgi:hypothetical protein